MAVRLAAGQVVKAVDASRHLLQPAPQRLLDELELILEPTQASWDSGKNELAADKLAKALELARHLRYA